MPLQTVSDLAFSNNQVAIVISRGRFGGHVGIAFHSAREGVRIVHLRFHRDLVDEPFPPENSCWIGCAASVPDSASKVLVGFVRLVAKRLPKINFGIDILAPRGSFGEDGRYKPPRGSMGLTCATFITEIFRHVKLPLIDEVTWVSSEENIQWGHAVCAELERVNAGADHVEAVRRSINGLRVRPEEVTAASTTRETPVDFQWAQSEAPAVMRMLEATCPDLRALRAL